MAIEAHYFENPRSSTMDAMSVTIGTLFRKNFEQQGVFKGEVVSKYDPEGNGDEELYRVEYEDGDQEVRRNACIKQASDFLRASPPANWLINVHAAHPFHLFNSGPDGTRDRRPGQSRAQREPAQEGQTALLLCG